MPDMNTAPLPAGCNAGVDHPFISDVAEILRRARRHIQDGTVRANESAERDTELRLLNAALATERVCVLRYTRDHHAAGGEMTEAIRDGLLQHASDEQEHADRLARRIAELGGAPNPDPEGLTDRSCCEYVEGETLADMLAEDLIAERIAIESYREIIRYLGSRDGATRRLFEEILAAEQEHAAELRSMREQMLCRALAGHCGPLTAPPAPTWAGPRFIRASGAI